MTVYVIETVLDMELTASSPLTMQVGSSLAVKAYLKFTDTSAKPLDVTKFCTWESSDEDIVSVSAGKLKALELTDETKIYVSFNLPGATINTKEISVKVIGAVKSLAAEPATVLGKTGSTAQLAIRTADKQGNLGEDVAANGAMFSSANKRVATVSNTGLVTLVGPGSTYIKAAYAGKNVSVRVKVLSDIPGMTVIPDTPTIQIMAGSTQTIKFKIGNQYVTTYVDLASSDTSVVKALPGKITGVSPGTATVTYSYYNGGPVPLTGSFTVEVIKKISSVSVSPTSISLKASDKAQLNFCRLR